MNVPEPADLSFTGSFEAASTAFECQPASEVNVTLTDVIGVNGPYTVNVPAGSPSAFFPPASVEEGTYLVSYTPENSAAFAAGSFAEQLVLDDPAFTYVFDIRVFVAEVDDPGPIESGVGPINGEFLSCRNVERDGETEFLVGGFAAADSADLCVQNQGGQQVQITIAGTDADGNPVGPIIGAVLINLFSFNSLPFGTYTLTESVYGNVSEPFIHQDSNATTVSVRNFYTEEPVYNAVFQLTGQGCSDPERNGEVDHIIIDSFGFGGADTCTVPPALPDGPYEVTIFTADGSPFGVYQLPIAPNASLVTGLNPGTYTMQLTGSDVSKPFTIEPGGSYLGLFVIYDDSEIGPIEPDPEQFAAIQGTIAFCTAPDISDTTQYLISGGFAPVSTSDCVDDPDNTGIVFLYRYEVSGDDEPVETFVLPVSVGRFSTFGGFGEVPPSGIYRIGYAPTAASVPTNLSGEFFADEFPITDIVVLYFGDVVPAADVLVRKDICIDPERVGDTDFFVQQDPFGGSIIAADETIVCRFATEVEGPFTYTLTNVETGASFISLSQAQDRLCR